MNQFIDDAFDDADHCLGLLMRIPVVQLRTTQQPGSWGAAGLVTDANAGIEAKDRGAPLKIRDAAGILKPNCRTPSPDSVSYRFYSNCPIHRLSDQSIKSFPTS